MDGERHDVALGLRGVAARRFPSDDRDVALLQPRDDRLVQARHLGRDRIRPELGPARPTAPSKEQGVAAADLHAHLFLPGFQILQKNSGSRFEIRQRPSASGISYRTPRVTTPLFIARIEFFVAPASFVTSAIG